MELKSIKKTLGDSYWNQKHFSVSGKRKGMGGKIVWNDDRIRTERLIVIIASSKQVSGIWKMVRTGSKMDSPEQGTKKEWVEKRRKKCVAISIPLALISWACTYISLLAWFLCVETWYIILWDWVELKKKLGLFSDSFTQPFAICTSCTMKDLNIFTCPQNHLYHRSCRIFPSNQPCRQYHPPGRSQETGFWSVGHTSLLHASNRLGHLHIPLGTREF